jgi:hypothetical protein
MKTVELDTTIDYTDWKKSAARVISLHEGEWRFYFEAPKGTRILSSRFIGITSFALNRWWSYEHKKWCPMFECGNQGASSTVHCNSFKAFKRHLRRHPELQTGETVTLASRFIGHDIHARWWPKLRGRAAHTFVVDEFHHLSKAVGSAGL